MLENLTRDLGAPCVMDIKKGARTYEKDGVKRWNKAFGQRLPSINIDDLIANFIRLDKEQSIIVAEIFLKKLEEFVDFFGSYHCKQFAFCS